MKSDTTGQRPGLALHMLHRAGQYADEIFAASIGESTLTPRQFAVLKAAGAIIRIPDSLGFGAAAGLCDGGLTALPFLRDTGQLTVGQHVLVNGASGSVGSTDFFAKALAMLDRA